MPPSSGCLRRGGTRVRRTAPISSRAVGGRRRRRPAGTFRRYRANIRRGPPLTDAPMPAELSDRLQANDAALAARVACGDAAALTPLYQRYRGPIYRFALLWSGSATVAADVTQDVFVHLLTHADDYDPARGALQPWLLGITRNFVHRRTGADARYVANDDEAEPAAPDLDAPTPGVHARDAARRSRACALAIAALPPHYRDVLVLVELAERSYAEAAAICGCELNTVRSRLSRARGLIARWLDATAGGAPARPRDDHGAPTRTPRTSTTASRRSRRRWRTRCRHRRPIARSPRPSNARCAIRAARRRAVSATAGSRGRWRSPRRSPRCRSSCARCRRKPSPAEPAPAAAAQSSADDFMPVVPLADIEERRRRGRRARAPAANDPGAARPARQSGARRRRHRHRTARSPRRLRARRPLRLLIITTKVPAMTSLFRIRPVAARAGGVEPHRRQRRIRRRAGRRPVGRGAAARREGARRAGEGAGPGRQGDREEPGAAGRWRRHPACPRRRVHGPAAVDGIRRQRARPSARDRQERALHRGSGHRIDPGPARRQPHRAQVDRTPRARHAGAHATGAQGRRPRRRVHLRPDGGAHHRAQRIVAHRDAPAAPAGAARAAVPPGRIPCRPFRRSAAGRHAGAARRRSAAGTRRRQAQGRRAARTCASR